MRSIAVEEHFISKDYLNYLRSRQDFPKREVFLDENHEKCEHIWYSSSCCFTMKNPDAVNNVISDMGGGRIKEMDKTGISMQVLSLTLPGVETLETADGKTWAKKINDDLAETVKKYPDRFIGLASLPLQEPDFAAKELERAIKENGLKGAVINSNVQGEYLDNKKYWVIFERAEKLGVPIYLHPKEPSPDMIKPFTTYPTLWAAFWGYGVEIGLQIIRLLCSGVFDEFPRLKIIIGHMGEALPFWMWRLDKHWQYTPMAKKLHKNPSEYIKENFLITTSGMFFQPALLCAYFALGADNILFAVDYPYESNETAMQFMASMPISKSDKEKIYHLNAEKLFSL